MTEPHDPPETPSAPPPPTPVGGRGTAASAVGRRRVRAATGLLPARGAGQRLQRRIAFGWG